MGGPQLSTSTATFAFGAVLVLGACGTGYLYTRWQYAEEELGRAERNRVTLQGELDGLRDRLERLDQQYRKGRSRESELTVQLHAESRIRKAAEAARQAGTAKSSSSRQGRPSIARLPG